MPDRMYHSSPNGPEKTGEALNRAKKDDDEESR
jgi:hypothetical protein